MFYYFFRDVAFIHRQYELGIQLFTDFLLSATDFFLNTFGFQTGRYGKVIYIEGTQGIFLDRGCLARNLMGLYVGFVLAYPGPLKHKLWYIPIGVLLINIFNVFRLGGLAIVVKCCPEHVDINHHYIFKMVVFALILLLWYIWVFKFDTKKAKTL